MRSVRFAELLLSLVTTESRAAVMAGDLIEESETRSRFWRAVLQTFAAQVWRGIVTNPWAMMRGAMLATLMQFVYFLPLLLAILLLSAGLGYLAGRGLANIPAWFMPAVGLIGGTALFPLVGRWIARRYAGEEGPRVIAFVVLQVIIGCIFSLTSSSVPAALLMSLATFAPYTLLTFLGVAWWRFSNGGGVAHA